MHIHTTTLWKMISGHHTTVPCTTVFSANPSHFPPPILTSQSRFSHSHKLTTQRYTPPCNDRLTVNLHMDTNVRYPPRLFTNTSSFHTSGKTAAFNCVSLTFCCMCWNCFFNQPYSPKLAVHPIVASKLLQPLL